MPLPFALYKGHPVPSGKAIELAIQLYEYKIIKFRLVDHPLNFPYPLLIPRLTSPLFFSRVTRPFRYLTTLGRTAANVAEVAITQSIPLTSCYSVIWWFENLT